MKQYRDKKMTSGSNTQYVLISINPKWCELIANGKKTIEVRKTRPKIETPFKCYIYETKARTDMPTFVDEDEHIIYEGRGQIIGEFVCKKIEKFPVGSLMCDNIEKSACLTYSEMIRYFYKPEELDGNTPKFGFGWHISDLVIYDEPKELSTFRHCGDNYHFNPILSRPPQSWCYVEELR